MARRIFRYLLLVLTILSCAGRDTDSTPNVVLVVVDALRADRLGCYGYERPTSPNLDRLAREGVVFTTAITQSSWTKASFSNIQTSLYPFEHGVSDWESVLPETLETLAEIMAENGYRTACVMNIIGLAGRFNVLDGFSTVSEADRNERDAAKTAEDAIQLIESSPRPFFLMVHFFDTHWPYRPPINHQDAAEGEVAGRPATGRRGVDARYDGCVHYVDASIGKMISCLESHSTLDSTIFVVTADHGEALGEHGAGGHLNSLFDEVLRVPLILRYPDRCPGGRIVDAQVRHIDILPTLVELTHVLDTSYREGVSLVGLIDGKGISSSGKSLPANLAYAETGIMKEPQLKCLRDSEWKLILEPLTSHTEVYDLRHDPRESENLWNDVEVKAQHLVQYMDKLPGARVAGWRVAFTGSGPESRLGLTVRGAEGAQLSIVQTAGAGIASELAEDGTTLDVSPKDKAFGILSLGTQPAGASIEVLSSQPATSSPRLLHVGRNRVIDMSKWTGLHTQDSQGIPDSLMAFRVSGQAGAFVWWVPGGAPVQPGETSELTAEEKKNLRALGYLH